MKDQQVFAKLQDLKNDPTNSTELDTSLSPTTATDSNTQQQPHQQQQHQQLSLAVPSNVNNSSPRLQPSALSLLTPRGKTLDWKDPRQWIEFFGEFREEDVLEEKRKQENWMQYFKDHGMGIDIIKTQALDRLVYEGIPNDLRARMWQICSGSIYRLRQAKNFGLYDQFVKQVRLLQLFLCYVYFILFYFSNVVVYEKLFLFGSFNILFILFLFLFYLGQLLIIVL